MKKIFESFTDFYKSRYETINEEQLTVGTKVELTDGRFGVIDAWCDEEQMYTVSIDGETESVKVEPKEIKQEITESNINEDHLTPGTKVALVDGRYGTIESWSDEEQKYMVSIEGETETVQVSDEEIVDDIMESELQDEYQEYFKGILNKYGVETPAELDEEGKKEFFEEVKKGWEKGKGRKVV